MAATGVSITMVEEKETKNTIRFAEVTGRDEEPLIGTLYVPKATVFEMAKGVPTSSRPFSVQVTVQVKP